MTPRRRPRPTPPGGLLLAPLLVLAAGLAACGTGAPATEAATSEGEQLPEEGLVVLNPTDERPYFHSFGRVSYGQEVRHTFRLQNREPRPLEIFSVQGGCACTRVVALDLVDEQGNVLEKGRPRSPQDVLTVPAWALVDFTVSMDTSKLREPNNDKLEIVRMRTSSTLTTFPTFELHLKTLQPFQITPPTLNLGEIPQRAGAAGVVRIVTQEFGGAARVLGVVDRGEGLEVDLEETSASGEFLWTATVRTRPMQPMGAFRDSFTLSSTDPDGQGDEGRHTIEVWGQVVPDIIPSPRTFSFRPLELGEHYVLRGSLRALAPGHHVRILGHRVEGEVADSIEVAYEPRAADAEGASTEWDLHLTALPSLPAGRFTGKVVLELDDPAHPEVEVPFSGIVQEP